MGRYHALNRFVYGVDAERRSLEELTR